MMKMINPPKLAIAFIILAGGIWLFFSQRSQAESPPMKLVVEVLRLSNGYGYQIKAGQKTLIYQEYIPSLPGKQVFSREKDASLVGHWVKDQLLQGHSPSISPQLLDSLLTTYYYD